MSITILHRNQIFRFGKVKTGNELGVMMVNVEDSVRSSSVCLMQPGLPGFLVHNPSAKERDVPSGAGRRCMVSRTLLLFPAQIVSMICP